MKWDSIWALFDSYSRVARLYPAVIALLPAVLFVLAVYPRWSGGSPGQNAALILVLCAVCYLLVNVTRSLGKRIEPAMIRDWGGWPTTTLLRYSDATIDSHTKKRYHERLEALSEVALPSLAEEQNSPTDADHRYRSATRALIEARRGPENKIVHNENASYGFRRNMLGLRPVAITISLTAATATACLWHLQSGRRDVNPAIPVLLAVDFNFGATVGNRGPTLLCPTSCPRLRGGSPQDVRLVGSAKD